MFNLRNGLVITSLVFYAASLCNPAIQVAYIVKYETLWGIGCVLIGAIGLAILPIPGLWLAWSGWFANPLYIIGVISILGRLSHWALIWLVLALVLASFTFLSDATLLIGYYFWLASFGVAILAALVTAKQDYVRQKQYREELARPFDPAQVDIS